MTTNSELYVLIVLMISDLNRGFLIHKLSIRAKELIVFENDIFFKSGKHCTEL